MLLVLVHIGKASFWQFIYVTPTYVTDKKRPILKFTLIKNHVHCLFQTCQTAKQYKNMVQYKYMTDLPPNVI